MLHRRLPRTVFLLIIFCAPTMASQRTVAQTSSGCQATEPVLAVPARDPAADPFGEGPWYVNADRSIWAGWDAGRWVSGPKGNKVLWIRPQGTDLIVTGRLLDGNEATPLKADIRCCYRTGFQASRVYFPAAGCWELTAKAGRNVLTFVTRVS